MIPFAAPVDDILFSLNHVADVPEDWDAETTGEILSHFASFAESAIAPTDEEGDQRGCWLEDGRVHMPDSFCEVYGQLRDQGWQGLTVPEAYGGQGMDGLVLAAVSEIFTGANHSLQMITGLVPGAIRTLMIHGTDDQRAEYLPRLASGEWLSTMCLTEPSAGSDLSAVRTKAVRAGAGWKLTGEKIFISGGDQNLSDGTLHLVLARSGTMDDGVRGLSLYLCPSHRADGSRNAVKVERLEHKMGLHASPTCQTVFDDADAQLIGAEGQGLRAMFTMMNHARLDVALQGVAHAARAADISRKYAAERKQGKGPDGQQVMIDRHGDVMRMIDEQDALAIGGRAMCHMTMAVLEKENDPALVEFLTPVCKAFCTDAGIYAADRAIQVLGGYGYLTEYRAEQNLRDARITSIYEGTNGIHAHTLCTRLLRNQNGAAAHAFARFIEGEIAVRDAPVLAKVFGIWCRARQHILGLDNPSRGAEAFMKLTAEVAYQAAWARIADAADAHPDPKRMKRLARHAAQYGNAMAPAYLALLPTSCG